MRNLTERYTVDKVIVEKVKGNKARLVVEGSGGRRVIPATDGVLWKFKEALRAAEGIVGVLESGPEAQAVELVISRSPS